MNGVQATPPEGEAPAELSPASLLPHSRVGPHEAIVCASWPPGDDVGDQAVVVHHHLSIGSIVFSSDPALVHPRGIEDRNHCAIHHSNDPVDLSHGVESLVDLGEPPPSWWAS